MKFKKTIATVILSICSFGATSVSANTPFAACVGEPLVRFDGTVVDAAIATPELSTLVTAVTAAGLGETLATTENITVYAPTNDAFAAIPSMLLTDILADVDTLTAILAFHVTPGFHDPRKAFFETSRRTTLTGQSVFFHRLNGEQRVNDAVVACTGVRTTNGIVWIIDSVLMPQF